MKAENERITIHLSDDEAREYFGNQWDDNTICVKRTEWATIKQRIDDHKFDKAKPQHIWHNIEAKLRSQAIYGDKWRAKEHMRRI